jgi:hypothetical protein
LLAQRRSNQEETASLTTQSYDRSARGDFSKGHPCPLEKRRTSCAAPSGSGTAAGCDAHLEGARQSQRPKAGPKPTSLDPRLRGDDGEVYPSFPRRREPSDVLVTCRRPCNQSPERWPQGRGVHRSGTWMSRVPHQTGCLTKGRGTPRPCGQRRSDGGSLKRPTATSRWIPAFAGMTVTKRTACRPGSRRSPG